MKSGSTMLCNSSTNHSLGGRDGDYQELLVVPVANAT